jgi:DNA invertase Pin-like site-specific DNA recombinase
LKRITPAIERNASEFDASLVGYVRVSTEEQNADMQVHALIKRGVHPDNIHSDLGVSGVANRRPGREMAIRQLREGMTLVVWKLDRVSRSLLDLLLLLQDFDKRGVGFLSLQDSIDTRTPIGKVMLAILGAFAEFERDMIAARTQAGVKRAMERGVKFGQPTKITDDVRRKINDWLAEGLSIPEIVKRFKAERFKLAESTIRKYWRAEEIAAARSKKRKPR